MKTISIGRDENCDIVIVDRTNVVSRRHAVITIDNRGKMSITDYSSNGTYVNGVKISNNVAVPITRKNTITFAHAYELDWNLVPNVRCRNLKIALISTIIVVATIVLIVILGPYGREIPPPTPIDIKIVDTVKQSFPDTLIVVPDENDKKHEVKEDPVKQDESNEVVKKEERVHKPKKQSKSEKSSKQQKDDDVSKQQDNVTPIIF